MARVNENFLDRFSLVHVATGAIFEIASIPAPLAIGAQVAFELAENELKKWHAPMFPVSTPDSWQNQIGDVASFVAGYYGARMIKNDEGGKLLLIGLAAVSGAIWMQGTLKDRVR